MSNLIPSGGGDLQRHDGAFSRPHPAPGAPVDPDTIDLREVIAVLRRRAWIVVTCTVLVVAAALVLVLREQPQYRATSTIRLKNERQAMTGALEAPGLDQMLGKTVDPLLSQLEVLRSRAVAAEVVRRTGTRIVPEDFELPRGTFHDVVIADGTPADTLELVFSASGFLVRGEGGDTRASYGVPVLHGGVGFTIAAPPEGVKSTRVLVRSEEKAIERMQENLRAVPLDKTDVVDVSFTSTDRELAQRVVNTAVEVFRETNARESQQTSRRRRVFIEEQLAKTDSVLADAQNAVSDFRRREAVFSSREKFAAQQVGMLELDMRREELLADRRVHARLLDALQAPGSDERALRALVSAPGVAQNPVIATLYQQLVRYQAVRDSLTTGGWGSAASNPDVQRLDALIGNARSGLVDAAAGQLATLDARLTALDELQRRHAAGLQAQPDKEAEEMRLLQRLETARALAEQLRVEYQKAQIAEAVEVGQVEVIDLASLPMEPIGSGKGLKLALALVLGLMLGSGVAFVREHLDTQIARKDELEPLLGTPVLAVIPPIAASQPRARTALRRHVRVGGGGTATAVARPLEELVTVNGGRAAGAEAYRSLRTNLLFSRASQSLRSIVVTSSMAAEGKTTTAANLAVTFAQQGLRVILADVDLRKARVHHIFGMEREPGLVDVLMGNLQLYDALRPTSVDNLSVMTAGTLPPNPAELLGNPRMRALLDELHGASDLVIMDAAPVLVAGDASIIGTMAHGTLLVVRAGVTERAAARAAVQQLRAVGAPLVGSVLNDPDGKVPSHEGHYYYGYSYYGDEHA